MFILHKIFNSYILFYLHTGKKSNKKVSASSLYANLCLLGFVFMVHIQLILFWDYIKHHPKSQMLLFTIFIMAIIIPYCIYKHLKQKKYVENTIILYNKMSPKITRRMYFKWMLVGFLPVLMFPVLAIIIIASIDSLFY